MSHSAMKTIGLVGGVSWVSTVEYYTYLNQMVAARLGGNHSAKCHLVSLEFGEVCANNALGDHEANYRLILQAAKHLASTGCELIVLCANTMHMHAERVRAEVPVELVHVAEATASKANALGLKSVALLGTRYVMEGDFYAQKLETAGLTVLIPEDYERKYIHRAIFDELTQNRFLPETKARVIEIIGGLSARGAEGIVLGCTELPILVSQDEVALPLLDTSRIHVEAIIERAFA